jgi:hypothetical protein
MTNVSLNESYVSSGLMGQNFSHVSNKSGLDLTVNEHKEHGSTPAFLESEGEIFPDRVIQTLMTTTPLKFMR